MVSNLQAMVTSLSSWAVSITAILGAVVLIFKPFRKWFMSRFERRKNADIEDIKEKLTTLSTKIDARFDEQKKLIDKNERERLKEVIFRYGNIARKCGHISGEEFVYLQNVFEAYKNLGGNSYAHEEYKMIYRYYNEQERAEHTEHSEQN